MTGELLVQICLGIISIVGAIATAYLVPFIKSKISETQLNQFFEYVKVAVRCAEQIYSVEQWQEKKQYVMDFVIKFMNEKLIIDLSYEQIDTIVEGIVNEVKKMRSEPLWSDFIESENE